LPLFIINTLFLPDEINQLYDFVSSFISAIWRVGYPNIFPIVIWVIIYITNLKFVSMIISLLMFVEPVWAIVLSGRLKKLLGKKILHFAFGIHKTLYSIFHAINFNSFRFKTVKLVFISVFEEIKSSLKISSKFDKTNASKESLYSFLF